MVDTKILKEELESYFNKVREALTVYLNRKKGQLSLIHNLNIDFQEIEEKGKQTLEEMSDSSAVYPDPADRASVESEQFFALMA